MSEDRNWTSEALMLFGRWLWKEQKYGYAMLCLHGPQWGLKIGAQVSIRWCDVINIGNGKCYDTLIIPNKAHISRPINGFLKDCIEHAYHSLYIKKPDENMYINYNVHTPLTPSTLNRDFQIRSKQFEKYVFDLTGHKLNFKLFKTNVFEIAWALDVLKHYNYSKQAFIEVSKHMGHRTVKDTCELLGVEPREMEVTINYENLNGFNFKSVIDSSELNDEITRSVASGLL